MHLDAWTLARLTERLAAVKATRAALDAHGDGFAIPLPPNWTEEHQRLRAFWIGALMHLETAVEVHVVEEAQKAAA